MTETFGEVRKMADGLGERSREVLILPPLTNEFTGSPTGHINPYGTFHLDMNSRLNIEAVLPS